MPEGVNTMTVDYIKGFIFTDGTVIEDGKVTRFEPESSYEYELKVDVSLEGADADKEGSSLGDVTLTFEGIDVDSVQDVLVDGEPAEVVRDSINGTITVTVPEGVKDATITAVVDTGSDAGDWNVTASVSAKFDGSIVGDEVHDSAASADVELTEGQSNEDSQTPNSDPQLPNTEPETEQALKVDGAGFGLLIYKNGRIETENISLVTNTDKQHGTEEIIDLRDFIGVSVADASAEDYVLFEGSPSDYTGLPSEAGGLYTSSNIVHLESGKSIVLSNAKGIFFTDGNTDYLPEGFTSEEIEIPGSTADEPMAASMMSFGVDADDGDSLEAFSLTDSMSLADDTNADSDDILSDGED